MKIHTVIFYLSFFPILIFGQKEYKYSYKDGYNFLSKAQKQIKKGKVENAKKLIVKAKESNYGFCGNSWASANSQIKLIESQILNKENKYDESLKILESIDKCSYGANCMKRDFLKIETLFLKFGKEKVKSAFKNVNQITKDENDEYENSYHAYIKDIDYNFNFIDSNISFLDKNGKEIIKNKTENAFLNIVQNQMFYELLE